MNRFFKAGLAAIGTAALTGMIAVPAFASSSTSSSTDSSTTASSISSSDSAAAATADDVNGCPTGHLPAVVEGDPASYHAGDPQSAWFWHDSNGYSIRVTHPQNGKVVVFSGEISSDRPIHVTGVQLEKSDHYWLSSDHKTLHFAFSNAGYVDGLDFATECASTVGFKVRTDGALLSPGRVRLGDRAVEALSNPFMVQRRH